MLDIVLDTLLDALKTLPFLFGAYLLMEYLEHRAGHKFEHALARFGPAGGALLGLVPQCGFSVAAANLYAGGVITLGTLLAVFLSTSDEAIPVLLAHPDRLTTVLWLLAVKFVVAVVAGLAIDRVVRREKAHGHEHLHTHDEEPDAAHCDHHGLCHHTCDGRVLWPAVRHTVQTFAFLLVTMFLFGLAVDAVGEARLSQLLMSGSLLQPVIAGLIGLIPNCAPSVLLTQLYLEGSISFGSAVAGLCTGAGVGLLVLFRSNRGLKNDLKILLLLYCIGTAAGALLQLLPL